MNRRRVCQYIRISLISSILLGVGPGLTTAAQAQVVDDSLLIDGHYRVFHYHKPSGLTRPGLIFVLHGSGGTGTGQMPSAANMEREATKNNILTVYPDGYKRYWNECRKASPAQANVENVDEQAFFAGMIDYFKKHHGADPARVFAVGTSGGGHMAYKLALTMPRTFRAITAIIANLPDSTNLDCQPSGQPMAVMIINGTEDPINPYAGGPVVLGGNMRMGNVRSTDQTLAYWAGLARYQGKPTRENVPDTDPSDGRTIERYTYHERGKPDVVLLKVIGGKHDYPKDIDVHLEALKFSLQQVQP